MVEFMEFMQGKYLEQTTPKKKKWGDRHKAYPTPSRFWSPFNPFKLLQQEPFKLQPQQEPLSDWAGRKHRYSFTPRQTPLGGTSSPPPSLSRHSSKLPKKGSSLSWWSETVAGSWNTADYRRNLTSYLPTFEITSTPPGQVWDRQQRDTMYEKKMYLINLLILQLVCHNNLGTHPDSTLIISVWLASLTSRYACSHIYSRAPSPSPEFLCTASSQIRLKTTIRGFCWICTGVSGSTEQTRIDVVVIVLQPAGADMTISSSSNRNLTYSCRRLRSSCSALVVSHLRVRANVWEPRFSKLHCPLESVLRRCLLNLFLGGGFWISITSWLGLISFGLGSIKSKLPSGCLSCGFVCFLTISWIAFTSTASGLSQLVFCFSSMFFPFGGRHAMTLTTARTINILEGNFIFISADFSSEGWDLNNCPIYHRRPKMSPRCSRW